MSIYSLNKYTECLLYARLCLMKRNTKRRYLLQRAYILGRRDRLKKNRKLSGIGGIQKLKG